MEVELNPDLQAKLDRLATETGRATGELLEDAVLGLFAEIAETRELLNSRYDDLKGGSAKPIDGEQFFETLQRREDELFRKSSLE